MASLSSLRSQLKSKEKELSTQKQRLKDLKSILSNINSSFASDIQYMNQNLNKCACTVVIGIESHELTRENSEILQTEKEMNTSEDNKMSEAIASINSEIRVVENRIDSLNDEIASLKRKIRELEDEERRQRLESFSSNHGWFGLN